MSRARRHIFVFPLFGLMLILSACASPPDIIAEQPPATIIPSEIRDDAERFIGERVRWGGMILDTANKPDSTVLTVLAYPLDSTARPQIDQTPLGRFKARLSGFHDPAVYKDGREITVIGPITRVSAARVGEFEYAYPLIKVDKYYLWQKRTTYREDRYYYDPFWDPFYPYYRYYPYYYYPGYPRRHIEGIDTQ